MNESKWCVLNNEIITQMNSTDGAVYDLKETDIDNAPDVHAVLNYE